MAAVRARMIACRRCPRLVEYRERVAQEKVRRYRAEPYWGRPVPSLGPADARLLIVGLAPAAHGGNRTGRIFTGDRSGDFLFRALHEAGFASQPISAHAQDGLRLLDCYITAVLHCAPPENRPRPGELEACRPYLMEELELLPAVRVVVALGAIAFEHFLRTWAAAGRLAPTPRPRFGHGAEARLPAGPVLLASYHPSQQNTQTGRLTPAMLARIFARAQRLIQGVDPAETGFPGAS
jgi:uracil-DNA glycosylase family 4